MSTTTAIVAPKTHEKITLKTKDGLMFVYRADTSDIKAIREACGNIDAEGEKKRSSSYERKMRAPLFKIEPDDVWLDCGAQIGSFSVRAAKNGAKKIIAIEPEQDNHAMLKENISRNKFQNVIQVEKCAIVGDPEAVNHKIHLNKTTSTYRHTLLPVKKTTGSEEVPAVSLKDLFDKYPDINAVKVDIEGSEVDVLRSMDWSATQVKKLVFEYSLDHHPVMSKFYDLIDHMKGYFTTVYHVPSLPGRDCVWDTKVTRGANGTLVWCTRGDVRGRA